MSSIAGLHGEVSALGEKANSGAVITSLAVLKANWDYRAQAYTDCFVPFVAQVLRGANGNAVDVALVQSEVEQQFGIRIPQAALKTILHRASRRGLVKRRNHEFIPEPAAIEAMDLGPARFQALRKHEALVDKLVAFCQSKFGREVKREEAERALLTHIETRTVPLLRAVVRAAPVDPVPGNLTSDQLEYVVGAFVVDVAERDPAGFEYLEAIVKGSMLASVLYLPDLGEAEHRFTDLALYFDTPFLLEVLGYNGSAGEASAKETLELVYKLGATLACFEDTATEIRGILAAVATNLRNPQKSHPHYGGVGDYFVQNGFRPSDIEMFANRLEQDLAARRIKIVEAPAHSQSLGVDEAVLREQLRQHVRYYREDALLHDLDALTAVYRLRNGNRFARLENARAVFVTTNDPLAGVARRFFGSRQSDASVPVALLDHEMATLAWLKKPMSAPDLPRKQIVADSLAALQPSSEMWQRYMSEIERLEVRGDVTQDDVLLLRYSCEAHQKLMEGTLGDPTGVSTRTVVDALGAAREAAALRAQEAGAEGAQRRAQVEWDALQRMSSDAHERAEAFQGELARVRTLLRQGAGRRAVRTAKIASRATFFVLSGIGVAAIGLAAVPQGEWLPAWSTQVGVRVITAVVGVLLGVLGWTHGTSASSLARNLELWLAGVLEKAHLRAIPSGVLEVGKSVVHAPPPRSEDDSASN